MVVPFGSQTAGQVVWSPRVVFPDYPDFCYMQQMISCICILIYIYIAPTPECVQGFDASFRTICAT